MDLHKLNHGAVAQIYLGKIVDDGAGKVCGGGVFQISNNIRYVIPDLYKVRVSPFRHILQIDFRVSQHIGLIRVRRIGAVIFRVDLTGVVFFHLQRRKLKPMFNKGCPFIARGIAAAGEEQGKYEQQQNLTLHALLLLVIFLCS